MKVRLTLDLSDALRNAIGQSLPQKSKTRKGLAHHAAIIAVLKQWTEEAAEDWRPLYPRPKLTALEEGEAAQAVDYLKKIGRSDRQIRDWLLLERARLRFPRSAIE